MSEQTTIIEPAPAKLNLFLHVVGRRNDGYHLLETVFAFTGIGDTLEAAPADTLSLEVAGPNATALAAEDDNLVLRAARALAAAAGKDGARARLVLHKRLPVAAGLGGGSADAAAALRALNRLWGLGWPLELLAEVGAELGADIPACVHSRPMLGQGIGTELRPVSLPEDLPVVLVNPGVPLVTAHVFRAFAERRQAFSPKLAEDGLPSRVSLDWVAGLANDLEAPARDCCAVLDEVATALRGQEGVRMVRMAGSGPTWFAVLGSRAQAEQAAATLRDQHPGWWVAETTIQCG